MIERKIVSQKKKEFQIQEFIAASLKRVGNSHIKMQKTPLGEKIIIFASRPGLVVGRKGQSIKKLTKDLKAEFKLENPQIEISEVEDVNLNAQIVAEKLSGAMERFGIERFKGLGHSIMNDVMESGALGVEILISGKVPSQRARRWRFYKGYLKKCGDIAMNGVRHAYSTACLKSGVVGIQVSIMPPDLRLPDDIRMNKDMIVEESEEETKDETPVEEQVDKEKKTKAKKASKTAKKIEEVVDAKAEVIDEK
ncbi:30S ribosomal protein S3 [Candidatus Woesearchaeota archaeon]|nr:30S ribosomal protein S3 [Candidatus Woesearchaeota archaeon]